MQQRVRQRCFSSYGIAACLLGGSRVQGAGGCSRCRRAAALQPSLCIAKCALIIQHRIERFFSWAVRAGRAGIRHPGFRFCKRGFVWLCYPLATADARRPPRVGQTGVERTESWLGRAGLAGDFAAALDHHKRDACVRCRAAGPSYVCPLPRSGSTTGSARCHPAGLTGIVLQIDSQSGCIAWQHRWALQPYTPQHGREPSGLCRSCGHSRAVTASVGLQTAFVTSQPPAAAGGGSRGGAWQPSAPAAAGRHGCSSSRCTCQGGWRTHRHRI